MRATAYVLVQILTSDAGLEVGKVRIFSEERPTLCVGGGTYTTLCRVDAKTYEEARTRAIEAVKLGWPWIHARLLESLDGQPRVIGARYFCPCGAHHDEGPISGERGYRCLRCGMAFEVDVEDVIDAEQLAAQQADQVHFGCFQAMSRVLNLSQDLEDIYRDGRMTSGQKVQDMLRKAQAIQSTAADYLPG